MSKILLGDKKLFIAIAFIISTLQVFGQMSGSYTINSALPASASNFTSFTMAVDSLEHNGVSDSVIISVAAGTYLESISIDSINGTSAQNKVRFVGNSSDPSQVVLRYTSTKASTNFVAEFENASFVGFSGIRFEAMGPVYSRVIQFSKSNTDIRFVNCHFIGTNAAGSNRQAIVFNNAGTGNITSNTLFKACLFEKGSYGAMMYGGNDTIPEIGNRFIDNTFTGFSRTGIFMNHQEHAEINKNTLVSTSSANFTGIQFSVGSGEISKNSIQGSGSGKQYGIITDMMKGDSLNPILISNNMVSTSNSTFSTSYGIEVEDGYWVDVFHNSVNVRGGNFAYSRSLNLKRGSSVALDIGKISVRNNILSNEAGFIAVDMNTNAAANNYATLDYNNFYSTGNQIFRWSGNNYQTLAEWQNASGQDANSVQGDPEFVSSTNLHVLGSLPNDKGDTLVGITTDIDGDQRPYPGSQIVDMGADEYDVPSCLPPSNLMVTGVGNTTATVTWTSQSTPLGWIVEYGPEGFIPGFGMVVHSPNDTLTLSGLSGQTNYDFYVQDSCGAGDISYAAGPETFRTLCNTSLNGTYTLDTSMATAGTNFNSFDDFFTELSNCGVSGNVTLNVKQGLYTNAIEINNYGKALQSNTVTVQSDSTNTGPVLVRHTNTSSENYAVRFNETPGVTFKNMDFKVMGSNKGRVIEIDGNCGQIGFIGCSFEGLKVSSINDDYALIGNEGPWKIDNLFLDNNHFKYGSYALFSTGSNTNYCKEATMTYNTLDSAYGGGFYTENFREILIHNNVVVLDWSTTNTQFGMYFSGSGLSPNNRALIYNNNVRGNSDKYYYGIYAGYYNADPASPSMVYNNMVYNTMSNDPGANRKGIFMHHMANLNLYHNSVSLPDGMTYAHCMFIEQDSDTSYFTAGGIRIKNNILQNRGNGALLFVVVNASSGSIVELDNNVYDANALHKFYFGGAAYNTLPTFQLATGMDSNSVAGDPIFTSSYDLHTLGPLANDMGDNAAGITFDIDGDARPMSPSTTVDAGADEFDPVSCLPSSNIQVYNLAGYSADVTWQVNGTATQWLVEYGLAGFAPGTGQMMTASNDTISLTGLTSATDYELYLTDLCTGGDTGLPQGPVLFSTTCVLNDTVPLFEGFESTQWLADTGPSLTNDMISSCWNRNPDSDTAVSWRCHTGPVMAGTGPLQAHEGSNYMVLNTAVGANGSMASFTSPLFDLSTTGTAELNYYVHMYGSNTGTLYIEVSNDSGATFTRIDSVEGARQAYQSDPWSFQRTDLSSFLSKNVALRFTGKKGNGNLGMIAIDDLSIVESPATVCPVQDSVLVADQVSCGSIPVTFTAPQGAPMTDVAWMDGDRNVLQTGGLTFTTMPLTSDTSFSACYFAEDAYPRQMVGPSTQVVGGGYGTSVQGQWFTVMDNILLDSVTVRNNGGNVAFTIQTYTQGSKGNILLESTDTITVSGAGDHEVPAGLYMQPGTYLIRLAFISGQTTGQLLEADSNLVYPYVLNGRVSIDSATVQNKYFHTFNWKIKGVCSGPVSDFTAYFGQVQTPALPHIEDFNAGVPCNWQSTSTGAEWSGVFDFQGSSLDSTSFIMVDDDTPGSSAMTNAVLYSPEFNVLGYDSAWFEFDHYFRQYQTGETGKIEVYNGTLWTPVYLVSSNTGNWFAPDHVAIDITPYQNNNLQFRITYDDGGNWGYYWALDNFEVKGNKASCKNFVVDLTTDIYGSDISWSVTDTASGQIYATGGPYADVIPYNAQQATHTDTICLPENVFFEFRLEDAAGNGLFDGVNTGFFNVYELCQYGNKHILGDTLALKYGNSINPPSYDSVIFEIDCALPVCSDPVASGEVADCFTALISWSSDSSSTTTLEYGVSGFTPGSGMTVSTTGNSILVQNLMSGTSYDYYLQDSCTLGSISNLVGPETFTTLSGPTADFQKMMLSGSGLDTVAWSFDASNSLLDTLAVWDFGDGSPADSGTLVTHEYYQNGSYQVVLFVYNECGVDTDTQVVDVNTIGVEESLLAGVRTYPNPTRGILNVEFPGPLTSAVKAKVFSATGQQVLEKEILNERTALNLDFLNPGVFILQIEMEGRVFSQRIILSSE